MADDPADPANLEGDALMRWYRQTPQEIEEKRRQVAAETYNRFFYPTQSDQALSSNGGPDAQDPPSENSQSQPAGNTGQANAWPNSGAPISITPTMTWPSPFYTTETPGLLGYWAPHKATAFNGQDSPEEDAQESVEESNSSPDDSGSIAFDEGTQPPSTSEPDDPTAPTDGTPRIATQSGGFPAIRSGNSNFENTSGPSQDRSDRFPVNPALPEDADFVLIGNPHNPRLRREWEKANNQPWPKTDDGRNYHVAHKRAIADGGTNTLDNIEPMHPAEHIAQHLNNRDSAR